MGHHAMRWKEGGISRKAGEVVGTVGLKEVVGGRVLEEGVVIWVEKD